ncbi:ABC transporter permease [Pseudoxanthomonas daejeonensis]|uniref:ABC transporter permease n=1 Tax=Pseudoxanthomonas daejeonensis TaxID=266062 RepID=UPI003CCE09C9
MVNSGSPAPRGRATPTGRRHGTCTLLPGMLPARKTPMTEENGSHPRWQQAQSGPGRIILTGQWTLAHALLISDQLRGVPEATTSVDASAIERLDSAGVMQLMRFAQRRGLDSEHLLFSDGHAALVQVIEDVADDRPRRRRDYGFAAALERLGRATETITRSVVELVGFTGENLSKMLRMAREPRRFRLTATVAHMEQVGLDAVPLVALLSYLVGAVIAFLGSTILRDFGAEIYVVELVGIAFLREFAVLLTAIVLAGRTASAFTAQIGAMKSREEIDAIRTLGLDPVDLLVIPRVLALLVMLPLLTFIAMMAGLAGGVTVGAFDLDIPPQMYLSRMHETVEVRHFLVGMSKAPVFALVIGLIGCLEGLRVEGTAQSVGERTTSSVVQTISLVIILDAIAALWFMHMDW